MRRVLAALLCAFGIAAAVGPMPAKAEPATLPVAGADLVSVHLDGGAIGLRARAADQVRAGEPGSRPDEVRFDAGGGFTRRIPDRAGYAFLGPPGTLVWVLATGDGGLPALDTTAVAPGRLAGDAITLRLLDVRGPGRVHVYALSRLGAVDPLLSSGESGPTATTLAAGQRRAGVAWAFDAAGSYQIRLGVAARTAGGDEVTDEATYHIDVPRLSDAAPPPQPAAAGAERAQLRAAAPPAIAGQPDAAKAAPAPQPKAAPPPAAAPPAAAMQASERKVIADGHVDMGPQLDGNTWTIRLRDDTGSPPVWRELSDVVLHAVDRAKTTVPAGADYAFLGTAGSQVWILPQAQQQGIVWPGWNTQDPSVVSGTTGAVTWRLTSVDGPGKFSLFLTGSFGKPEVLFDSGKALPQQIQIPPNTHAHGSWAFTSAGIYRLGVEMSGTTRAGQAVSDRKSLTIAVGPVDPNDGFQPGTGNGSGDGTGNGSGGGEGNSGGDGGKLPRTGSSWVITATVAGVMLVAGGWILVWFTRRRRSTADRCPLSANHRYPPFAP